MPAIHKPIQPLTDDDRGRASHPGRRQPGRRELPWPRQALSPGVVLVSGNPRELEEDHALIPPDEPLWECEDGYDEEDHVPAWLIDARDLLDEYRHAEEEEHCLAV